MKNKANHIEEDSELTPHKSAGAKKKQFTIEWRRTKEDTLTFASFEWRVYSRYEKKTSRDYALEALINKNDIFNKYKLREFRAGEDPK